jgi:hypothetical protein
MSCYNWEQGTIQLPKSKYASIKKEFIAAYNAYLLDQLDRSKRLREHVLAVNKGKRNVQWFYDLQDNMQKFGVEWDTLNKMIATINKDGKKPSNLNKKLMNLANSKTLAFDVANEGQITFINGDKSVAWYVSENNRAVEACRESKVGSLFFRTLGKVEWTRGSGGEIAGNDEYNREDCGVGGGGNYVTATFGKPDLPRRFR